MDFKHRLIKLELNNGKWLKLYNKDYSQYDYKNAYVSVSRWLNKKDVEIVKESFKICPKCYSLIELKNGEFRCECGYNRKYKEKRVLLDSEILIDFDNPSKDDVLEVLKRMENQKEERLKEVVKSSIIGLHLIYSLKNKPSIANPKERFNFYVNEKKRIAEVLKGCNIDFPILLDIYRIRRIPFSYNGNKGCFSYSSSLYSSVMGISPQMMQILQQNISVGQATRSKLPCRFFKCVSNIVYGMKDRYIVHIKVRDRKRLKDVCEVYKIRQYVIRRDNHFIELISPKIIDYRRLVKILKYCNASNLRSFLKFRHSWIRTSSIIDVDGRELFPKPEIIELVQNEENAQYSKFHSKLFSMGVGGIGKENKTIVVMVGG